MKTVRSFRCKKLHFIKTPQLFEKILDCIPTTPLKINTESLEKRKIRYPFGRDREPESMMRIKVRGWLLEYEASGGTDRDHPAEYPLL